MDGFADDRRKRNWRRSTWVIGALILVVALGANQFAVEMAFDETLVQTGCLLFGIGIAAELSSKLTGRAAYRTALLLAVLSILILGWVTTAVGIVGSEYNDLNLMYGGVIVVAIVGVILARFRSRGMSRAMYATALAQVVATTIAFSPGLNAPFGWAFELVAVNGFFFALFIGSAVLFSRSIERKYGPPLA